ncbi:hypothetical protein [Cohnella zeiphila]|uniref:Fimbrial assembly protein n=1 Tax=Cohnella zeiphila TaxID=2761120 RepID=A0A7X0VXX3_9BACL|nr:hypothetical protein [Cohnella zeiphila]MBB6734406.1 hypothetical protein [Cohnella zeiphila]
MEVETAYFQEPPPIAKQKPLIHQPLFIIALVLAIISVAGVGYLYQMNTDLKKQSEAQQTSLDELSKRIEAYKADSSKLAALQDRADAIAKASYLTVLQHDIEGGVVTDDFVVSKTYFSIADDNKLDVTIDLDTQPQMNLHYTGQGAFDLSDRELRAKSLAIIDAVKNRYASEAPDSLPKWDGSTSVSLTIKNYAIGDSSSGEFKLVGEK